MAVIAVGLGASPQMTPSRRKRSSQNRASSLRIGPPCKSVPYLCYVFTEPVEPDHLDVPFALNGNEAARLPPAAVGDPLPGRAAEGDRAGDAVALHPGRGV